MKIGPATCGFGLFMVYGFSKNIDMHPRSGGETIKTRNIAPAAYSQSQQEVILILASKDT